ncbi:MAG: DMT family transporter [Candidatus Promineifilaceae bacterium]
MTETTNDSRSNSTAPLVIAILLVVDSLHFVFARLLHPYLPGGTAAMYVLGFAALEVTLFLGIRGRIQPTVFRQHAWFFLTIGFLVATATTLNYIAIGFVDPGTASLLAQMSTVFALGMGLFWLREKLTAVELLGALVALVGVFIISFQPTEGLFRIGSFMVLGSAFLYALHTAVVKRFGEAMDFSNFFLFRVVSTAAFLLLFTTVRGQLLLPPKPAAWFFLILTGTVDVVISRVLYYLALRRLRLSYHTILLTLSPVITILWSLALFQDRPKLQGLLGGAAVILGVLIVTVQRAKQK